MPLIKFPKTFFILSVLYLCFNALNAVFYASEFAEEKDQKINSFQQLDSLIQLQRGVINRFPSNSELKLKLISLLCKKGAWEEAENATKEIISKDPPNLNAKFILGEILQRTYRLEEAEQTFKEILELQPNNLQARIALAGVTMLKQDLDSAEKLLTGVLPIYPNSSKLFSMLATVKYQEGSNQEARDLFHKAIQLNPGNSTAYFGLSRVLAQESIFDTAQDVLGKAIECDYFNADAHVSLGRIYFNKGNLKMAGDEFRIALKIDPYNYKAHDFYGHGLTDKDYSDYPKLEDYEKKENSIWKELKEAKELSKNGDYDKAEKIYQVVLNSDSTNIFARMALGSIYWMKGEPDLSLKQFQAVLEVYPDYGAAHKGIYRVLSAKIDDFNFEKDRIEEYFDELPVIKYDKIEDVFTNFSSLTEPFQKSILFSIAPLTNFLPALKVAGATFYILPLDEKLTDDSTRKWLAGTRTFDLRLWDDIPGNGGLHATAGIGSLRDAINMEFSEVAHEFAHQVHNFALTEGEKKRIRELFKKALLEKRCLDSYGESDEFEHFAEGVEAYVSVEKRADQKGAHGHTRDELRERDPALFTLIKELGNKKDISENILAARVYKGNSFTWDNRIDDAILTFKEVLNSNPDYVPALNALGYAYFLKDSLDLAIKIHHETIEKEPKNAESFLRLGKAYYFKDADLQKAIEIYKRGIEQDPSSSVLYLELAKCLEILGRIKEAELNYKRALENDPSCYSAYLGLASVYVQLGFYAEADSNFQQVLAKKKTSTALCEYGKFKLKQYSLKEAEESLALALELDQNNLKAKSYFGLLLCKKGNFREGVAMQEKIVEKEKEDIEILNNLIGCLLAEGETSKAGDYLEIAEDILGKKTKQQVVYSEGDYGDYGNYIVKNIRTAQVKASFYLNKGRLLSQKDEYKKAIAAYKKSIEELKFFFDAYLELAPILIQSGNEKEAEEYLDKLIEFNPGPNYYNLALELRKKLRGSR